MYLSQCVQVELQAVRLRPVLHAAAKAPGIVTAEKKANKQACMPI
jgi:hypothetical protein